MSRTLRQEFPEFSSVQFMEMEVSPLRRFWYEQSLLPNEIQSCGADVLLSAGNFALRNSPVPQILLSRNSLYTSEDFYRDLLDRHEYGAWFDARLRGWLAKKSIQWADVTVAPSEAFAVELRRWTGIPVRAIHHGFDQGAFTRDCHPLAAEVEAKLQSTRGSLKLLFVSHYNYYRNFETLLRSLPLIRERLRGYPVKLLLTCALRAGKNPGTYHPESAARLIDELGISEMVIELGSVPYHQLHRVYRQADIYVTPAYTETFAHPLVEAMASGLPVVASDLAVHREICGDAALYFERFSSEELARSVAQLANSAEISKRMATAGLDRSQQFSWKKHAHAVVELARSLVGCAPTV